MQAVTHLQADKDCGIIHNKKRVPGFVPASLKGAFRMFNTSDRVRYAKPQMIEVICQLRFPTILSIEAREPVDFQERIRRIYPLYGRNIEKLPPKVTGQPGNMKLEEQPNVTNYQFATADSSWRVNMTKNFISLATNRYTVWEDFAGKLDEVLADFIKIYQPAHFERIGLRYINAFSRRDLGLGGEPFSALIAPGYLGLLNEDDIDERKFVRITQEAELQLPGGCRTKIHCGPGMVKKGNVEDKEVKYILDLDVFMSGKVEKQHSAGALMTVHMNADRLFRGAITQTLHDAMEPEAL